MQPLFNNGCIPCYLRVPWLAPAYKSVGWYGSVGIVRNRQVLACCEHDMAASIRVSKQTCMAGMQAVGASILEQLAAQRQQINHVQATVHSADQNLDKSRQILKRMSSWWSW